MGDLTIPRLALAGMIGLGVQSIMIFGGSSGLVPKIFELGEKGILPTLEQTPFSVNLTRLAPVDGMLKVMTAFFWQGVNGDDTAAAWANFLFATQAISGWTLLVVEGARRANRGGPLSFTTTWGMLIQTLSYAVAAPSYFLLHLFTSPTSETDKDLVPSDFEVPEETLTGIPFSTVLGFIIPTILMGLPSPSVISVPAKVLAIVLWQPFPVWTALFSTIWQKFVYPSTEESTQKRTAKTQIALLRRVYQFALAISAPTHVALLGLSLASVFFPGLFTAAAQRDLNTVNLLQPPNPFGSAKMANLAQGVLWFTQFDYGVTAFAYLIWAITMRYSPSVTKISKEKTKWYSPLKLVAFATRIWVIGMYASALSLIWERDEIVFGAAAAAEEEKAEKKSL